ncbi:MAG TPA: DUF4430 domain-containing protein [Niallia sp.]|nr:DUF4430 domain-containing protein [Niallia sp.]
MIIKKTTIILPVFLFFIFSPALAFETTGTFRIINDKNETIVSKEVSFQEGETLYEVTKRAFDIGESEGNIISINSVHSIPEKNIHWAFFINGKFVEVGLDEITLYTNDYIVGALRSWDEEELLK